MVFEVPCVELCLEKVLDDFEGGGPEFMKDVVVTGEMGTLAVSFPMAADAAVTDSFVEALDAAIAIVGNVVFAGLFFVAVGAGMVAFAVWTDSMCFEIGVFRVVTLNTILPTIRFAMRAFGACL